MRHAAAALSCLLCACRGPAARHGDGGLDAAVAPGADAAADARADAAIDAHADAAIDASVDGAVDAGGDAGVDCSGSSMLYESATLPSGPFNMLPAVISDGDDFVGVRFTTTTAHTIRCLGATIYTSCQSCSPVTMVMAIVPLDGTTHLPATTDLSDAVGYASGAIPYYPASQLPSPPSSAVFPTSITLPAGTWGLVVASDRLGVAFHEGDLPINVTPAGSPSFFHYMESGDTEQTPGVWTDGLAGQTVRMFVMGN